MAETAAAATKHCGRDTTANGYPFANVGRDAINSVATGAPAAAGDNVVHVTSDGSGGVEKEASGDSDGRLRQFGGRTGLKVRRLVGVDGNGDSIGDERQDDEARLMASIARLDVLLQKGATGQSHHKHNENHPVAPPVGAGRGQNCRGGGGRNNKGSSPKTMASKNHARGRLRGNATVNKMPIIATTAAIPGRGIGTTR